MAQTTKTASAKIRTHQPDEHKFHAIHGEDIQWKPFAAYPPDARLAILVGDPSKPGPYLIRIKLPSGTKMMPHKHPEDRIYTVMSGVFYIGLGEVFDENKLTAFAPGSVIPSWAFELGGGYPVQGIVNQEWKEWTGRFVANWTPKLDFTDQTLIYASYSRGYKGGGANPPGPIADFASAQGSLTHPPTFAPEFVNAYELGTKNTLLDGAMTINGDESFR